MLVLFANTEFTGWPTKTRQLVCVMAFSEADRDGTCRGELHLYASPPFFVPSRLNTHARVYCCVVVAFSPDEQMAPGKRGGKDGAVRPLPGRLPFGVLRRKVPTTHRQACPGESSESGLEHHFYFPHPRARSILWTDSDRSGHLHHTALTRGRKANVEDARRSLQTALIFLFRRPHRSDAHPTEGKPPAAAAFFFLTYPQRIKKRQRHHLKMVGAAVCSD